MAIVKYKDQTFECVTALKGDNYVHLMDANGCMIAAFDNVTDFSAFTVEYGAWQVPVPADSCYIAVIGDDGLIRKGSHRCSDIGALLDILELVPISEKSYDALNLTGNHRLTANGKLTISLVGTAAMFANEDSLSNQATWGPFLGRVHSAEITADSSIKNMDYYFVGSKLVDAPAIPSGVTSMASTFKDCHELINVGSIPLGVGDMLQTFMNCTSLQNVPALPRTATSLSHTFAGCTALIAAPEIPSTAINISGMFRNCTSLLEAPSLPRTLVLMRSAFEGCSSLAAAPDIPVNVTDMQYAFKDCASLTGTITIAAGVTDYKECFSGAATHPGCRLVVNYSEDAEMYIDDIIATKSANSNIVKGDLVLDPRSVDMN